MAFFYGGPFKDQIIGTDEDDTFLMGGGDDVAYGQDGNDTMFGGHGFDSLHGGDGDDQVEDLHGDNNLFGDAGNDHLLSAGLLHGGTGNDLLFGSSGNDQFFGDEDDDLLFADGGADLLDGGTGFDTLLYSGSSAVTVNLAGVGSGGQAEGDTYANIELVQGTDFGDTFIGDNLNNEFEGLGGADTFNGGNGLDTARYKQSQAGVTVNLATGTGSGGDAAGDVLFNIGEFVGSDFGDVLTGNTGFNILDGGVGNDVLDGGAGGDILEGGDDNDTLTGGAGGDALVGGIGIDTATYLGSTAGVTVNLASGIGSGGDAQGDTLSGIENLTGSTFGDTLFGSSAANVLSGSNGNDVLEGLGGGDTLNGGNGNDTANYDSSNVAVQVNLTTGTGSGGHAAGDTLISIENLIGSNQADTLTGNSFANIFEGLGGADTIDGAGANDTVSYAASNAGVQVNLAAGTAGGGHAAGDTLISIENVIGSGFDDLLTGNNLANVLSGGGGGDQLSGGLGNDILTGGIGADPFIFNTALNVATNVDIITDFNVAEVDTILLDDAIFTGLGGIVGNSITLEEFRIGAAAQDADDRIIYNDVTGALLFDADGVGGAAAVQFATLSPGLALTNGLIGII